MFAVKALPALAKPLMVTAPVSGTRVIVTVTVSDLVVSSVEVAVTVKVSAVSSRATISRPSSIVVPAPPPVTDHVTVWSGLLVQFTVAKNC